MQIASRTTSTGSVPATWSRPERAAPRKVTAPRRRAADAASRRSGSGARRATSTAVTRPMSTGAAASSGSGVVLSAAGSTVPLRGTGGGSRPRWRSPSTAATVTTTSTPSATSRRRPLAASNPVEASRRRPRRPSAPPSRVPTTARTGSSSAGARPSSRGQPPAHPSAVAVDHPRGEPGAQRRGGHPQHQALEQRDPGDLARRPAAGHEQRERAPAAFDHQPRGQREHGEGDAEQPRADHRDHGRRRALLAQVLQHEGVEAAGQPQVGGGQREEATSEARRGRHREDLALDAAHLVEQGRRPPARRSPARSGTRTCTCGWLLSGTSAAARTPAASRRDQQRRGVDDRPRGRCSSRPGRGACRRAASRRRPGRAARPPPVTRARRRWLSETTEPGARPWTRAASAETTTSTSAVPSSAPAGCVGGTVDPSSRTISKARGGAPSTYRTREAKPGSATSLGSVRTVRLKYDVSVSSGSAGVMPSTATER